MYVPQKRDISSIMKSPKKTNLAYTQELRSPTILKSKERSPVSARLDNDSKISQDIASNNLQKSNGKNLDVVKEDNYEENFGTY